MAEFFKPVESMAAKKKVVVNKKMKATEFNKPRPPKYVKGYRHEAGAFQSMFGIGRK